MSTEEPEVLEVREDIDNLNKERTIDETYNEILNKSSILRWESERLFWMWKWLKVVVSELCIVYWSDKIAEYLQWYMNDIEMKEWKRGNLFDFIAFIEPNKKERTLLYDKLSEQSLENIVCTEEKKSREYYNSYPASYKLDFQWTIAEWKHLDTLLWKMSNFKCIWNFQFSAHTLEQFWFYEKLWESDWDVIKLLNELRNVLVSEEEVKLWTEIEPLLVKLEQRLTSLKEEVTQIDLNLLHSANKARDDFNANFSLESTDELDALVSSWLDAFKKSMKNLQKSVDDIKNRIEKEVQDLNEKKSSLLNIRY